MPKLSDFSLKSVKLCRTEERWSPVSCTSVGGVQAGADSLYHPAPSPKWKDAASCHFLDVPTTALGTATSRGGTSL